MKLVLAAAAIAAGATAAGAQPHQGHDRQPVASMSASQPPSEPQGQTGHGAHAGPEDAMGDMPGMAADRPEMTMAAALGAYPAAREASGTSWQPDASPVAGAHVMAGEWMLMGHALINAVYDRQSGPRGGERGFASGMAMGMAQRPIGPGTLQLRAMLSPEPLMGARGYPLLLATGETADGRVPLVDRQHPHDLFMEASASYSLRLSERSSAFLYAGLPGEPAFGPPAFMHRLSIMDSPEAPISHHWLDSTHISFGVVTGGLVLGDVKLEASRFNGREPDQHRWDIESGPLASTSLRLSWNPNPNLALQASWAHLVGPEQLAPAEDSTRWSASAIYTRRFGARGWWSTILAWGNRDGHGALALESAAGLGPWTLFGRAERVSNDELMGLPHGPAYRVGKLSLGLIRDFRVASHLRFGLGALQAFDFVPGGLRGAYDGNPRGAMAFLRLKVD